MYTNPSLIVKGRGQAEAKNQEIVIIDVNDLATYPADDGKGVKLVGNYVFKAGKYATLMQVTASKTSLPFSSEGEEDNISLSALPEFQFPGSTLEAEEFVANWMNRALIIGVKIGNCGDPNAFYRMYGNCAAPLSLMPEGQNDNDATAILMKFQQFAKTGVMPSRYYGTFTLATANAVAEDATTIDATPGTGEYQLVDNTEATVITDITNATTGGIYTIKGSGGTYPATIAAANPNFLLAGAVDWQGLSGATLTVEAIDVGSSDHVFVERSRT